MEAVKKTVAVLMGGQSSEHEISIKSGTGVAEALAKTGYTVLPVTLTREGQWVIDAAPPCSPYARHKLAPTISMVVSPWAGRCQFRAPLTSTSRVT